MSEIRFTDEQLKIFDFVENTNKNICIEAYAGCSKTTVIVEASKRLPDDKSITFLAFNKHIKEELVTRLPKNVKCFTSHGLGLNALLRKYGKDIKFDEFKIDKIIQDKSKKWDLDIKFDGSQDKIEQYLNEIKKMVNLCRTTLTFKKEGMLFIIDRHGLKLNDNSDIKNIMKVMEVLMNDRKTYDYTDMIFLPAIDKNIFLIPQDVVVADECLPYNQYIATENDKIKIGVLYNMYSNGIELPLVETFNEDKKIFENKKIEKIWCNGKRDVYQVILNGKRKLRSTVNHRFLTLNGWKRLDELKIGDAILSNYKDQPYHDIPNKSQYDIFIGTSLGDSSFNMITPNIFRISNIHGEKQYEYIKWKSEILNSNLRYIKENGYSKKPAYTFSSKGFYFEKDSQTIEDRIKKLNPRSLAVLWMDDGSLNKLNGKLYLMAVSKEYVEILSNTLKNKFNIISNVRMSYSNTTNKPYFYLNFNSENISKLSKLIAPYIHPSMSYKICDIHKDLINLSNWDCHECITNGCIVVTKEFEYYSTENVYDMTVEDNHNFIVTANYRANNIKSKNSGLIAHNCQDLNAAQQKMIDKMLKRDKVTGKVLGRLISVGDPNQLIYSFLGVQTKSFDWFKNFPNTEILSLSYTFRCGKKIVEHAQKIVPNIKALPHAVDGCVREGNVLIEPEDGDFVLCRTTMPLVKLFFHFLTKGKKASIKGSDIGISILEMIGKFNDLKLLTEYWNRELISYQKAVVATGILNYNEHSGYTALEDKVLTLVFLCRISKDITDLKLKIQALFTEQTQGIVLSTVHKSKGLEADRVFIVRPDLLPMKVGKAWEYQQEKNLEYVAITRSRLELIYDYNWKD